MVFDMSNAGFSRKTELGERKRERKREREKERERERAIGGRER